MKTSLPSYIKSANEMMRLSLPISATMMINIFVGIIGMWMVAQTGYRALAAGALAHTTYFTIYVFGMTGLQAVSIHISHIRHKTTLEEQGQIVKHGLFWATCLGVPLSWIVFEISPLLLILGQNPQEVEYSSHYLHMISLGILPSLWNAVIAQYFNGIGRPRINFAFFISLSPITVFLCYCFVFGSFQFPKLGLGGLALGLTLSQWLLFIIQMLFIRFNHNFQGYNIFRSPWRFDFKILAKIIKTGLPIGTQYGLELMAISTVTYFMGWVGTKALAAQQIVQQCALVLVMYNAGLTQATSILISEAFGQENFRRVHKLIITGYALTQIVTLIAAVIFVFYPNLLIGIFISVSDPSNATVVDYAATIFSVAAILQLFESIRTIGSATLRGLHKPKIAMQISISSLWFIGVPMSYLLGFVANWGAFGVRFGFVFGYVFAATFLYILSQRQLHLLEKRPDHSALK